MSKKTKPSSTFEVWSAGKLQTTITGHKEAALIEARHWAWIFRGYLPVEIFEVTRTLCAEETPYTRAINGE